MTVLVTGAAGFIGYHVAERLLARGERVLDEFNRYYDPKLKQARAERLAGRPDFEMVRGDIADPGVVADRLERGGVDRVVHLAAQAGVRWSLDHPFAYERANLAGHLGGAGGVPSPPREAPSLRLTVLGVRRPSAGRRRLSRRRPGGCARVVVRGDQTAGSGPARDLHDRGQHA